MNFFWLFLIIFGVIIILAPEIIAYLLWGFMIFLGINIFISKYVFFRKKSGEDYVAFWKYKIYKD